MEHLQNYIVVPAILFVLLLVSPISVHADEEQVFEVATPSLNMRAEPADNAEIIGQLDAGTKLTVFDEQYGWVKTFYNGEAVWVAKNLLIPIQQAEDTPDSDDHVVDEFNDESNEDNETEKSKDHDKHDKEETAKTNQKNEDSKTKQNELNTKKNYQNHQLMTELVDNYESIPYKTIKRRKMKISKQAIKLTDSLSDYKIMLDPGHGGEDPGAIYNGTNEKELTLSAVKVIANYLRNEGATVYVTRINDQFITLDQRVKMSNDYNVDAFISVHFDAFTNSFVNGLSTHFYKDETSLQLAKTVHQSLLEKITINNRGVRLSNYRVLRKNNQPAILLELGFMSNPKDFSNMKTNDFQIHVAEAITNGLKKYFDNL